jgi:sulfonate transport system substrate-binding protein
MISIRTLLIAVLLALAAPSPQAFSEGAKEIRIALQPIPFYAPIFVVKEKGWLEEALKPQGIAVKWSSFSAGPPMNEAFAAGQQDVGVMGDTPALIAKAAGQDTRLIALDVAAPTGLAVLVAKDSAIKTAKDLLGKKVAVVKGSYAHHLLVLVLNSAGLTLKDIEFINLPHPDIATALTNGEVDAGVVWEPLITRLVDNGAARVLADGVGIKQGEIYIFTTQAFASKNGDVLATFLKTFERGREFIRDHPDEAVVLVAKNVVLPVEQLGKVLAKGEYDPAIRQKSIEELKKTEKFLRETGVIKNPVDVEAFVDTSYLKQAGLE